MDFDFLKVSIVNQVGWLEYDNPPINMFSAGMLLQVGQAIDQLVADPEARVIVIASALEKHFSVGADVKFFDGITQEDMLGVVQLMRQIVHSMRQSPKPLLAAIHGTAVGGGLEITLHCDVRFAASDARFGQPEIAIGFIPPIATVQALVRLLGRPRAIRYLYEGTLVSAQEALSMGMVDILHPPESLRGEVQAYAEALAGKPPEALEAIRKAATGGMDLPFEEAIKIDSEWAVRLAGTRNFQEGVKAFLEKREPNWEWE